MNFRFLYDPQRQLFAIGYRLADAEGPGGSTVVLRPARLRGAARELRRHRQGRRPRERTGSTSAGRSPASDGAPTLLSWSATMFEYLMPLLVMRSYPGHAARRVVPHGRAPADRVRRRARRAVGHLRVRVQRRRSPRQLPVQGVRRARPRPEARPRRRAGRRAVRDGARRDDRPAERRARTCGGSTRGGRSRATTASSTPSTTPPRRPTRPRRARRAASAGARHGRARRSWPTTRA